MPAPPQLVQYTLGEIAGRFGLPLRGDAQTPVRGVATLGGARPDQLSFLANPRYRAQLRETGAAAVILREADTTHCPVAMLIAEDPYPEFAQVAQLFETAPVHLPGVHPTAVINPSAQIDPSAGIGAHAVIGARSRIAAGCVIGPGCVIGEDCTIGVDCELIARVTLVTRVRLGARVRIHPGAVIGADGFGLAMDRTAGEAGHWLKVPQLGGVAIGDDCEIGANTTIDRGALEDTVLEEDVRLDNQIQIGHGAHIGAHTAMAGCAAVAGSARIGRYCLIGGGAGIVGHLELCDRVTVTAMTLVTHSIRSPGEYSSGTPVMDNRLWRKNAVRFKQLDALARRLQRGEEPT